MRQFPVFAADSYHLLVPPSTSVAALAHLTDQTEPPSGTGVLKLADGHSSVPQKVRMLLAGTGADNGTLDAYLWGWTPLENSKVWIAELLYVFTTAILSTDAVVIGGTTYRFADALGTITVGTDNVDYVDSQPGTNRASGIELATKGAHYLQLLAGNVALSATGGAALVKKL